MLTPKLTHELIAAAIEGFEARKKRIDGQIDELRQMLNGGRPTEPAMPAPRKRKRRLSAAGRLAIAEATRKRWAAVRAAKATPAPAAKKAERKGRKT
jgi:hypothetical protein